MGAMLTIELPASRLPMKVCGLTRQEDADCCRKLHVGLTGFIFAAGSPRAIAPEQAASLDTGTALRVGVFAGASANEIKRVMETARLDFAQLHGNENERFCRDVGPDRVIKVIWPDRLPDFAGQGGIASLSAECARFAPVCRAFLLDAGATGGGSGRTLAWDRLRDFHPERPWLLAGGLGPGNIAEALRRCRPFAIDCNSGVEDSPGRKNSDKLTAVADYFG